MTAWFLLVGLVVVSAGCQHAPRNAAPAAAAVTPSPSATLEALDTRIPVPLLPMMAQHQKQNMRDHLSAVQRIISGIQAKDFDGISKDVATIGYSEQMGRMCTHMGAGAPAFADQALRFHHTADKIGEAARAHDMPAVLAALDATLATCTGCHSAFKQKVVDEATWAALVGQPVSR